MKISRQRTAVAPVLATLLMIAVAVAMSVIIFMWSQGFLSQTSSATGGQQGAQNVAAQSSISIELATFTSSPTAPGITLVVRNVGAVSVTLGTIIIAGNTGNADFHGSVSVPVTISTGALGTITASDAGAWTSSSAGFNNIAKGKSVTLVLTATGATTTASTGTAITSGDVINIKVTTTVGTFAQAQFTVP